MSELDDLSLRQFQYALPDDRIARFPLAQRDASKLLVYRAGSVAHARFSDLPDLLPADSFLVFNNTKVIPARLHFSRATGAAIELFLLNPVPADRPMIQALADTGTTVWQGMIGNRKRWKPGETLTATLPASDGQPNVVISADWHDPAQSTVQLRWTPADLTFAEVIQRAGEIPLPPYLKRDATDADRQTYQTVYSEKEGAVAAPTAGLHFTPAVFEALVRRGIAHDYLTLHVGAGTFQPIKTDNVRAHPMHTEQVVYSRENIEQLLRHAGRVIPVGTTSMRALESLYWMGVRLLRSEYSPFVLDQHYAYALPASEQPATESALKAVLRYLTDHKLETVTAQTSIYITPGYRFRLCRGIVTNFHQPGSTLILLIAALIGNDWRSVYEQALQHDYRFLSYGDSSLLLP